MLFRSVKLPDGRSLSKELLRFGYAWHYKRYDNTTEMAQLESDARTMRRGLWQYDNPVPPWVYRRDDTVKVAEYKGTIKNLPDNPKERKPTTWINLGKTDMRLYSRRTVFICTNEDDEYFHRTNYCTSLGDYCRKGNYEVTPIVQKQAEEEYERKPCPKCW